jgi:RNA polymerase sigma-70 factor (ECF subfamily)
VRPLPVSGAPDFSELFREHAPFVYRVLRRLGVAEDAVEDVCQEVFLAVHQGLAQFEGRSSPRTWIYTIALRRAANHVKRRVRERRREAEPALLEPASGVDPAAALDRQRACALLDALLSTLDEDKRQVFVLYELEELGMREVAEIVGCPLPTAYSRLHAARSALKRVAKQRGVTP